MCKMFEVVTGRKTKGNKDKLEGMLKTAMDSRKTAVIMSIPVDMLEIDIRAIWNCLGEILGENYEEELLDELFSRFCVGK